ncbi:saxitoxin and tetrodotoxin-binding protein 1-like [Tautogolabrus adspersus]
MSLLKQAMLLLLLAAVGTYAAPEDCDGLNKTVPAKDLHKIMGDWVLVWSVSDSKSINVENISSSHVELRLRPDNNTISYIERNMFLDSSCTTYNSTVLIPSEQSVMDVVAATMERDGVVSPFNDSAKLEFFETCPECLVMVYRGDAGQYLLIYRKEGHHQDIEKTKEAHSDFKKLATCLGLPHDDRFTYKDAQDFCHKKFSPEQA